MDGHEMTSSPAHRAGAAAGSGDPGSSGYGGWDAGAGAASGDADSLTTPLLVGESARVAEKKVGRHRRRSAGLPAHAPAAPPGGVVANVPVSYTHLTLPTKRIV